MRLRSRSTTCNRSMPDESVAKVCEVFLTYLYKYMHAHIMTEVTEPAIKVARDTHREGRQESESEKEEKGRREVLQRYNVDREEERGYIIYTGFKGLHKNSRFAKKNDDSGGASWFDAPYRRENYASTSNTGHKGSTKNRSRIVKPAANTAIASCRRSYYVWQIR